MPCVSPKQTIRPPRRTISRWLVPGYSAFQSGAEAAPFYTDSFFPFSRPVFFLLDRPGFVTWPHIDEDGKLCLLDDVRIERPDLVHDFLRSEVTDAFRLVEKSEAARTGKIFSRSFIPTGIGRQTSQTTKSIAC